MKKLIIANRIIDVREENGIMITDMVAVARAYDRKHIDVVKAMQRAIREGAFDKSVFRPALKTNAMNRKFKTFEFDCDILEELGMTYVDV